MTLVSLVSRQIWPQVLTVAHLRPQRVILLHSQAETESLKPAQRLAHLLVRAPDFAPPGGVALEPFPHDDFAAMAHRLAAVLPSAPDDLHRCVLHFTGGNKLMAAAVFRHALLHGLRSFYFERGKAITWFEPTQDQVQTRTEAVPRQVADALDPADLLACQFGHDSLVSRGERLTLNASGQNLADADLQSKLRGTDRLSQKKIDFRKWLDIHDPLPPRDNEGDPLEYATALALLHCGVSQIRRGIEWTTQPNSNASEAELDLVFNHAGRLWVVDCKDRSGSENKLDALRSKLLQVNALTPDVQQILASIENDLRDRDLKILREDLMQIAEVGGQEAWVLAVRSRRPSPHVYQFAARLSRRLEILVREDLLRQLPNLLNR